MFRVWAICLCWILLAVSVGFGRGQSAQSEASYALEKGKAELGFATGFYKIEATDYSPGGQVFLGGDFGIGITGHVAVQLALARASYRNDLYFKPELPHNPYLATANLLGFRGGGRYEFREKTSRARPYIGVGVAATTFTNVKRGPNDLCFPDLTCIVMAPELFQGVKLASFECATFLPAYRGLGRLHYTIHSLQLASRIADLSGVSMPPAKHTHVKLAMPETIVPTGTCDAFVCIFLIAFIVGLHEPNPKC